LQQPAQLAHHRLLRVVGQKLTTIEDASPACAPIAASA
jgi:hypothetical protein